MLKGVVKLVRGSEGWRESQQRPVSAWFYWKPGAAPATL
jgi:hypothetical protein